MTLHGASAESVVRQLQIVHNVRMSLHNPCVLSVYMALECSPSHLPGSGKPRVCGDEPESRL